MNIKNNVSLSVSEAVELLAKLADSLETKGEFAFDLKGQEVSIEAGDLLNAKLSIKPKEFSIVFDWNEETEGTGRTEEGETYYEPPKMVREVNLPDDTPKEHRPQIQVDEPIPQNNSPRRALPERMALNTTTLPYDAGYWAPAFTSNSDAQWTLLNIEGELENKKWASDEQITSLSDLTPASAKPKTKRTRKKDDDDLFSELDNLDKPKPKSMSSSPSGNVQKVEVPDRRSAVPAGNVQSIPSPSASRSSASVPGAVPKTSASRNIPSPKAKTQDELNWEEPKREDSSQDSWVKPSQVLKNKGGGASDPKSSIPSPTQSRSTQDNQSKKHSIPSPNATRSSPSPNQSIPTPTSNRSKDSEVNEWKEPSREENVTDDDWIKPSEFLNRSNSKENKADDAINRPPPTAPDAKKKSKDDEKGKGWASWD